MLFQCNKILLSGYYILLATPVTTIVYHNKLQKELIKKANNKQDYNAIADEIFRLREQKEKAAVDSHSREESMKRIKELQDFIGQQATEVTDFDEELVRRLIEKVTVFTDHFTVEFKSGVSVDITE